MRHGEYEHYHELPNGDEYRCDVPACVGPLVLSSEQAEELTAAPTTEADENPSGLPSDSDEIDRREGE